MSSISLAKAKVAVRKRKKALEASESSLIERLMAKVSIPPPIAGKDGRDAPTLSEILEGVVPLLPETKVIETTVKEGFDEDLIDRMIKARLPEIQPEDRPAVEQITNTIDVSEEKLEGFVSKVEFKKALQRIQDAITANQSGGAPARELPKVIEVTVDTTISSAQLDPSKYNIVLVKTAGITVTLPAPSDTVLIEVKQGFTGTGTYTICRE